MRSQHYARAREAGTGAVSHVSVRSKMQFFNKPCAFAAVCARSAELDPNSNWDHQNVPPGETKFHMTRRARA